VVCSSTLLALLVVGVASEALAGSPVAPTIPSPFGNLCAAAAALSPSASREHADTVQAQRWASDRLSEALARLVLARRVAGSPSPGGAERATQLLRDLYVQDVGFWLSAKSQLCACSVFGSEPPASCAQLGHERHRAMCEGVPARGGRGIDICRLTKGR